MFKPQQTIKHRKHKKGNDLLHNEFGLISWNIHKKGKVEAFQNHLFHLQEKYPADILTFQEAEEPHPNELTSEHFETLYTPNLQTKNKSYGLVTASIIPHYNALCLLSAHQELFFKTHKSTLISCYQTEHASDLIIVNIHALNFRRAKTYEIEIETLISVLKQYSGPLIIAGDFNAWTKPRNAILEKMQRTLSLSKVTFQNAHHIKQFRTYPLDCVFYRNLNVIQAEALDTGKLSDHNPLYARFSFISNS